MHPVKGLIVTADDFGAAREVNDAIEDAHTHGVLTATSLMVAAPAASDAVARARRLPGLRVGLHIVLVEGRPMLPPSSIPDLVDETGHFRTDMVRSATEMFFRPGVRRQLTHEIEAQFDAFQASGLRLDHVNTHKHFHLHPTIASTILKVGKRHGMRAMRVPLEPREVLMAVEPGRNAAPAYVTDPWARLSRARLRRAGLVIPDQVFGLAWSGAMNAARLAGLIGHLPAGLTEIYLHPATGGGFEGAAPGYRYADELQALLDPQVMELVADPEIKRGGFVDF
jgi:hopanoid biosynthesis associated protein HpnK